VRHAFNGSAIRHNRSVGISRFRMRQTKPVALFSRAMAAPGFFVRKQRRAASITIGSSAGLI
jgi:hypothetical protein